MNSLVNELRMDSNRLATTLVTDKDYSDFDIFSTKYQGKPAPPKTDRGGDAAPVAEQKVYRFRGSLEAIHNVYHVFLGGFQCSPTSSRMWAYELSTLCRI